MKRLALIFVLLFICGTAAGYLVDEKYVKASAVNAQVDKYKVRSDLLMEAMNSVGSCNPESAADTWANGLMKRSAAMQYSVMSKELKVKYAEQLEKTFPNWVTGISSPWVDSFKVTKRENPDKNTSIYHLNFVTKTSTGPAGTYSAILTIKKDGDFWRISNLNTDKGLDVYTGLSSK